MAEFYHFSPEALTVVNDDKRLIMSSNEPVVTAYLSIADLQIWMTTLEKAIEEEPNVVQEFALKRILYFMKYTYEVHLKEHSEFVSTVPEIEDLDQYLIQYANHISKGLL